MISTACYRQVTNPPLLVLFCVHLLFVQVLLLCPSHPPFIFSYTYLHSCILYSSLHHSIDQLSLPPALSPSLSILLPPLSRCLSIHESIYLSIYLPICWSMSMSTFIFISLPFPSLLSFTYYLSLSHILSFPISIPQGPYDFLQSLSSIPVTTVNTCIKCEKHLHEHF